MKHFPSCFLFPPPPLRERRDKLSTLLAKRRAKRQLRTRDGRRRLHSGFRHYAQSGPSGFYPGRLMISSKKMPDACEIIGLADLNENGGVPRMNTYMLVGDFKNQPYRTSIWICMMQGPKHLWGKYCWVTLRRHTVPFGWHGNGNEGYSKRPTETYFCRNILQNT